jgi:hypothetical protein
MATFLPIVVDSVLIATTDTVIGQPASTKSWAIAVVRFCNTDSSSRTLTLGVITGGSLDDQHSEYKTFSLIAGSTFEYGPAYLDATQMLVAKADVASKISARIHGIEKTPS